MRLIPHVGVGTLRFGMDEAAVRAALGEPTQRLLYEDGERTALAFDEGTDVVLHAAHGLVAVTRGGGPAMLFGADLFARDRDAIKALLAARVDTEWRTVDGDTRALAAPSLGLIVYFDADGEAPRAVELASGTWHRGARIG